MLGSKCKLVKKVVMVLTIGETIHLTGEVEIVVVYANVNGAQVPQNTFFGAKLSDGRNISLRNLIKPSLAGYKFEGCSKKITAKRANLAQKLSIPLSISRDLTLQTSISSMQRLEMYWSSYGCKSW